MTEKTGNLLAIGGPARSGKDTIGKHLRDRHGYVIGKFTSPIRAMITTLYLYAGATQQEIEEYMDGAKKEEIHPVIGASYRHMAQQLGATWGRDSIRQDLWVDMAFNATRIARDMGYDVVITDLRYPNEAEAVKDAGGFILLVDRPALKAKGRALDEQAASHESENYFDEIRKLADETLINDSDLFDLKRKVDRRHQTWRAS